MMIAINYILYSNEMIISKDEESFDKTLKYMKKLKSFGVTYITIYCNSLPWNCFI